MQRFEVFFIFWVFNDTVQALAICLAAFSGAAAQEAVEPEPEMSEREKELNMASMAVDKLTNEANLAVRQAMGYREAAKRLNEEARIAHEHAARAAREADAARRAADQLLNSDITPNFDFERVVKQEQPAWKKAVANPVDLSSFLWKVFSTDEQRVCKFWWERNCVRPSRDAPVDLYSGAGQKPSQAAGIQNIQHAA